jgi:hypothetical protein
MTDNINDKTKYVDLAMKVANQFKDETNMVYGFAMNGVDICLNRIQSNPVIREEIEADPRRVALYITWYVKTCIEVELGYDNQDTQAWKKGRFDEYIRKSAGF